MGDYYDPTPETNRASEVLRKNRSGTNAKTDRPLDMMGDPYSVRAPRAPNTNSAKTTKRSIFGGKGSRSPMTNGA